MRAFIIVNGQELAAHAGVSFRLTPKKGGHPALLDIVEVLDEAVVVRPVVPAFDVHEPLAGKDLAFVAEVYLLSGQFFAEAFQVGAAAVPRAAALAAGLRRVLDPAAEVAVHPAGGDQFHSHPDHADPIVKLR